MAAKDPMGVPQEGTIRPLEERTNLCAGLARLPKGCRHFLHDHEAAFLAAPGSGHNHQFHKGGLADHYDELFAIAATLHRSLSELRPLPFTLDEALLILFLHDLEKIYKRIEADVPRDNSYYDLAYDQHALQARIIKDYGLTLNDSEENALEYVHGEGDDYRKDARIAGPLAAFVHDCDYWSARGWFDEPRKSGHLPDVISA